MAKQKHINTTYIRSGSQGKTYNQIAREGVCPFCYDQILRFHNGKIVRETKYWSLIEARWPYKNTRLHLLFISKKHITELSKLTPRMWTNVSSLFKWCLKHYKIPGGAVAMRFGDSNLTGATVHHLHWHLIEPKRRKNGRAITVPFPIG